MRSTAASRIDITTALYVPPLENGSSFESFQEIIAHLRAPDGCPWDREQTYSSLRKHLLEETYEALSAMDQEDPEKMAEEFGDLLLQIVLNAQIGSENGDFSMVVFCAGFMTRSSAGIRMYLGMSKWMGLTMYYPIGKN